MAYNELAGYRFYTVRCLRDRTGVPLQQIRLILAAGLVPGAFPLELDDLYVIAVPAGVAVERILEIVSAQGLWRLKKMRLPGWKDWVRECHEREAVRRGSREMARTRGGKPVVE